MGTLTGTNLLSRIQDTLQDTTSVRWPEAELLRYINDAQREIVNMKPESSATHSNINLAVGTEQALPSGGLRLIKVVRNMSGTAANATGKRSIRIVDIDILNTQEPNWHDSTVAGDAAHGSIVKHYMFDPDDPKKFFVYPGISSAGQSSSFVEIVFSKSPTDLSSASSTIDVDDTFGNAIIDFVLYKAYLKDSEYAGNAQRASQHYQLFTNSLASSSQSQNIVNPNFDYSGSKASNTASIGG